MIRSNRRSVVEDCEIVNVTDTWERLKHSLPVGTVPTRGSGQRFCLPYPFCGRRAYKLYRPIVFQKFACRIRHNLTYTQEALSTGRKATSSSQMPDGSYSLR